MVSRCKASSNRAIGDIYCMSCNTDGMFGIGDYGKTCSGCSTRHHPNHVILTKEIVSSKTGLILICERFINKTLLVSNFYIYAF